MNKIIISLSVFAASFAAAQTGRVGINTTAPAATLEIKPKTTDGSQVEGTKLPTQSKAALAALEAGGKTPVEGTIVYVDDASAGTGTTVANVFEKGYYIFQEGVWNKMNASKNPQSLFNKTFKCTADNVGQVLKSSEGFFTCRNNPYVGYSWRYDGMMYFIGWNYNMSSNTEPFSGSALPISTIGISTYDFAALPGYAYGEGPQDDNTNIFVDYDKLITGNMDLINFQNSTGVAYGVGGVDLYLCIGNGSFKVKGYTDSTSDCSHIASQEILSKHRFFGSIMAPVRILE